MVHAKLAELQLCRLSSVEASRLSHEVASKSSLQLIQGSHNKLRNPVVGDVTGLCPPPLVSDFGRRFRPDGLSQGLPHVFDRAQWAFLCGRLRHVALMV